ncbi:FAD-dependent oxidoreductase [Mycoplasmopsis adleri]|uniref:FAD-dependent oxidoreductase n=1 Tax=Mycoplasmopsis adleri TaxID=51362 RepID=UPI0038737595
MKIIVIGANHAGTSFIRTLKTVNPDVQITAYDRNTNVSFLGCGIAVWVSGEMKQPDGLFYSSPEILENDYHVNLKTNHEVIKVDTLKKEVTVKDNATGKTFTDTYDKLVFAGGTWPIEPKIKGIEYNNVVLSKLYQHAQALVEYANNKNIKSVAVVGAGYIGTELAEAFRHKGKKVTLIDIKDRVIGNYFDKPFTQILETKMVENGIKLALNEKVVELKSKNGKDVSSVVTDKGEYAADLVIMCVGFKPRTDIIDVDKLPNGAIKVNKFQQSISNNDVYALGDACALKSNLTNDYDYIALATNAVKTGVVAALSIAGANVPFPGVVGTNAINAFDCHYASTGFTLESAIEHNFKNAKSIYFEDYDKPEFMHDAEKVACEIVYDDKTKKLLGAQIGSWGKNIHTETIYMLAMAIQQGLTLDQIALSDVYFLPHFNKPFNFVLVPILKALGIDYKY